MSKEELEILKTYEIQLQEMISHFIERQSKLTSIVDDLDSIRVKISRKIGSLEGWYLGETEF